MAYLDKDKVDSRTRERMENILSKSYVTYWRKKRIFDLFVSIIILTFAIIPILFIALIIWIDDPHGSPIYKQKRVGRHGVLFDMYKFRSMYVDADKRKKELLDQNEMDGPVFKIKNDPRITRVGKFIRKYSIDELAQMFNVLKGDMSLVGPRPPLPEEFAEYTDYDKLKLIVTPGVTCTWQISDNRNNTPFSKWVEMDLDYLENRTTWGDLKIVFKTPLVMLKGSGR